MNDFPLVSIITPSFNSSLFLEQTILSVLSQTYLNWELLIQDDFSTDDTYQIALNYSKKFSNILVEQNSRQRGAAFSRNRAIQRSKGQFLAFLDSDDIWCPNKLSYQINFMIDNNVDFSFTEYEHISETGVRLGLRARVINSLSYNKMLYHCWPGCLTVIYKQNLANKIYGPDIPKNNDHALFLRVLSEAQNPRGLHKCLAYYRIRKNSISRHKHKVIKYYYEVLHDHEKKNALFSFFCVFTHVVIKVLFKYKRICIDENNRTIL